MPKDDGPEAVRKRLNTLDADPDMHEALDDAELEWSSFRQSACKQAGTKPAANIKSNINPRY